MITAIYVYLLMGGVVIFINEFQAQRLAKKLANKEELTEDELSAIVTYTVAKMERRKKSWLYRTMFWVLTLVLWLPVFLYTLFVIKEN